MVKNPPASAGDSGGVGSIAGSERSPGGGHGNPLQYSCLGNLRDRGAWRAAVRTVAKSQTWLKRLSTQACIFIRFKTSPVFSSDFFFDSCFLETCRFFSRYLRVSPMIFCCWFLTLCSFSPLKHLETGSVAEHTLYPGMVPGALGKSVFLPLLGGVSVRVGSSWVQCCSRLVCLLWLSDGLLCYPA